MSDLRLPRDMERDRNGEKEISVGTLARVMFIRDTGDLVAWCTAIWVGGVTRTRCVVFASIPVAVGALIACGVGIWSI